MNKYKLINLNTKEEQLCDKVTIDGFEYYVSDEPIKIGDINIPSDFSRVADLSVTSSSDLPIVNEETNGYKKVIATNNPNIDIPKVVNEVENILDNIYPKIPSGNYKHTSTLIKRELFIEGYNKSQETNPFSENDVIEFSEWKDENKFSILTINKEWASELLEYSGCLYTTKELLQLWKEQQPKTVYYE